MIKWILLYLWQLPQNLLGLFIIHLTYALPDCDGSYIAMDLNRSWSGVSLGNYIIFALPSYTETDLKHEQGHQRQSCYLGPFYLLLIGLPSAIGNLVHRVRKFDYYKQPWERWADELGGVSRCSK